MDFKEFEKKLGVRIVEAGVSSGCYHVVDALFSFYMKRSLNKFKDLPLIFETNVQKPDKVKRKLLCFGTCVRKYKKEWDYLSECHPRQANVMDYFRVTSESEQIKAISGGLSDKEKKIRNR